MMLLPIFAVLCLASAVTPVPVYGTTRYGRPPWAYRSLPYYRQPYPFQTYPDELYYRPDPHYPYYPMARPYGKDMYQTMYPYYYNDRMRPYGYYADGDEMAEDVHEDRSNGRTEALPVGQETWFEGETVPRWQSDYDDVNAAFLQNLIMSQVYNDAMAKGDQPEQDKTEQNKLQGDDYDKISSDYYGERDTRDFEDEDVRELKALAGKPLDHSPKTGYTNKKYNQQWYPDYSSPTAVRRDEDHYLDDYPSDEGWINWASKRSSKQAPAKTTMAPSTTVASLTTKAPSATVEGQKEEVLLRPATPVRHPFPEPVLKMLAANQKKRTPSVYDTIKQMLSMDEPFAPKTETKARVQKRYVGTGEDLVGELRGLKRRIPA